MGIVYLSNATSGAQFGAVGAEKTGLVTYPHTHIHTHTHTHTHSDTHTDICSVSDPESNGI